MKPLSECRLYAFVDTAFLRGRSAPEVAAQLCAGGADLIQLRAKQVPLEQVREMAKSMVPVTQAAGVGLVINDYPEIAAEIGAEFCHLGQEDFFETGRTDVSQVCGKATPLGIGLSTHSPEQARKATAAGADYLAVGPVFPTGTKPSAQPVGFEYLRWASRNIDAPWFAIGGINLKNVDAVLAAGAKRICVVSAILNASDVGEACRQFRRKFEARAG